MCFCPAVRLAGEDDDWEKPRDWKYSEDATAATGTAEEVSIASRSSEDLEDEEDIKPESAADKIAKQLKVAKKRKARLIIWGHRIFNEERRVG